MTWAKILNNTKDSVIPCWPGSEPMRGSSTLRPTTGCFMDKQRFPVTQPGANKCLHYALESPQELPLCCLDWRCSLLTSFSKAVLAGPFSTLTSEAFNLNLKVALIKSTLISFFILSNLKDQCGIKYKDEQHDVKIKRRYFIKSSKKSPKLYLSRFPKDNNNWLDLYTLPYFTHGNSKTL